MGRVRKDPIRVLNVGDLVKCVDASTFMSDVDAGAGIVIQVEEYDPDQLSIHVIWSSGESLWYEQKDLEIIDECR